MRMNDDWVDNKIGGEGAKTIGELLKKNSTLTELDLTGKERAERKRTKTKELEER